MHEVFFSRGDVQKAPGNVIEMIHVQENTVNLHPQCHAKAESREGKELCVRQLILYEGYTNLADWIAKMAEAMKGTRPIEELNFLKAVMEKMS